MYCKKCGKEYPKAKKVCSGALHLQTRTENDRKRLPETGGDLSRVRHGCGLLRA